MAVASLAPAGASSPAAASPIDAEAASAATDNAGLADDAAGAHAVAWWRFDASTSGDVVFDGSQGSNITDSIPAVVVRDAGMELLGASAYLLRVTVAAGQSYLVGIGTNDPDASGTYRLLVSNVAGVGEWIQDPDVTRVWAQGDGPVDPSGDAYTLEDSLGRMGFHGFAGVRGTLGHTDPGRMPGEEPAGSLLQGEMEAAAGQLWELARAYTSPNTLGTAWGPDYATPSAPRIETPIVSDDALDLVGYHTAATQEGGPILPLPGAYRWDVYAAAAYVSVRSLQTRSGRSATPEQPDAAAAAYLNTQPPGAGLEWEGDLPIIEGVEARPDEQANGSWRADPDSGAPTDGDPLGAQGIDYRYWPEWRATFTLNLNPLDPANQGPDAPPTPARWGPVAAQDAWMLDRSGDTQEWRLVPQVEPDDGTASAWTDPRGHSKLGVHWYGTTRDPGGGGTFIDPSDWQDYTFELGSILEFEDRGLNNGSPLGGLMIVALPPEMQSGLPSPTIIPSMPPDPVPGSGADGNPLAFSSTRLRGGHSMAVRTVMRPVRYRAVYQPVLPDLPQLTTDPPWVRALQRTDGLDAGGPPRAVQNISLRSGII